MTTQLLLLSQTQASSRNCPGFHMWEPKEAISHSRLYDTNSGYSIFKAIQQFIIFSWNNSIMSFTTF